MPRVQVDIDFEEILDELSGRELQELAIRARGSLPQVDARLAALDERTLDELVEAVRTDDGRRACDLLRPVLAPYRSLRRTASSTAVPPNAAPMIPVIVESAEQPLPRATH